LVPLAILTLLFGIFPNLILDSMTNSVNGFVSILNQYL